MREEGGGLMMKPIMTGETVYDVGGWDLLVE